MATPSRVPGVRKRHKLLTLALKVTAYCRRENYIRRRGGVALKTEPEPSITIIDSKARRYLRVIAVTIEMYTTNTLAALVAHVSYIIQ